MEWLHDDEITWEMRFFSTNSWYSRWYSRCDRRTDGLRDWWTNGLSNRDAIMHLVSPVNLLWHLFSRKYRLILFLTKAWPTNGRTDFYQRREPHFMVTMVSNLKTRPIDASLSKWGLGSLVTYFAIIADVTGCAKLLALPCCIYMYF